MTIKIRIATDTVEEKLLVERRQCDFAVSDRGNELFATTKEDSDLLSSLSGWRISLPGGKNQVKRFFVRQTLDGLCDQLARIYQSPVELIN
jgi:hypothetical protein